MGRVGCGGEGGGTPRIIQGSPWARGHLVRVPGTEQSRGTGRWKQVWGGAETKKETEMELHTEEGDGAEVVEEMGKKTELTEGKGKEKETEAELDVVILEGGSEDGIGEETLDAE
jgi:hypothetical protein